MIFQEPMTSLNPVLSIGQQLTETLIAHRGYTPKQALERACELLELVRMSAPQQRLAQYPHELSGGMQKRAGFARSIILQPKIILFDEPTAGLDPVNTGRLLQNILSFKKRGMTAIFVTHDIPAAFEICDRIAILNQGKIELIMSVDEMKKSNHVLVKSFTTGAHIR
jgi:ABC-type dipeptide/oligopeptide/nickel transport system ATPase component